MENLVQRQRVWTLVIRWTARIWSIASLGLILAFYIGECFNPALFKPIEWLLHLFFPVGISVGMILAWWKESIGGSLTVGSLIMFYVIHFATTNKFPRGWTWLVFAAPGFLFLLYWYLMRKASKSAP